MPLFTYYPLYPYLMMAVIQKISNLPVEMVLTGSSVFIGVGLTAFAIFMLVKKISASWYVALSCSLAYLTSPSVWSLAVSAGVYGRALGVPFIVFAIWSAVCLWTDDNSEKKRRFFFVLTIFFSGIGTFFHPTIGVIVLPTIFLLGILINIHNKSKWKEVILVSFFSVIFSASFLIPFSKGVTPARAVEAPDFYQRTSAQITPLSKLIYIIDSSKVSDIRDLLKAIHWQYLSPFIVPLFLFLLFISVFRLKNFSAKTTRLLFFSGFMFTCWFVFVAYASPIMLIFYHTIGGPPIGGTYVPIFTSFGTGILLFVIFKKKILRDIFGILLCLMILAWFKYQVLDIWTIPGINHFYQKDMVNDSIFQGIRNIIPSHNQFNYRIGDGDDNGYIASWLNIEYPLVPQTRDYFSQGVVNQDYYAQKDILIWHKDNNIDETNFLFDWWGVQQFLASPVNKYRNKFNNSPYYTQITGWGAYRFNFATPILSTSGVKPFLVIGDNAYDFVFRGLGEANLNSQMVIPIHGGSFIDDYSLEDLEHFKVILIYNYRTHNDNKAVSLLNEFVRRGGRLVIESNSYFEIPKNMVDPFPITSIEKGEVNNNWNFSIVDKNFNDIDFIKFGKPEFNKGPWGISYALGIRDFAHVVLKVSDEPVVVAGNLGKGQVIWSGLNLPYHINYYNQSEEAMFMAKLLGYDIGKIRLEKKIQEESRSVSTYNNETYYVNKEAIDSLKTGAETEDYKIEFINPQKRVVDLKGPASGILFKEFYVPNWRAYLDRNGTISSLPIYKAGPDFMYVPLANGRAGDKVFFEYGPVPLEVSSNIVSLFTSAQ